MKRLIDFVCAGTGLVLLSPLLLLVALLIKADSPGPVLFRQARVGRHGRLFKIKKFRTMTHGAVGVAVTVAHDARITRIGRHLRATKLDELPQLLNVLCGEMSLVGPRPEVPEFVALYSPEQQAIMLSVRPGITDFAAIEFKDENDLLASSPNPRETYINEIMPIKYKMYERYVRERNNALDLYLIFRTLAAIIRGA